MFKSSLTVWSFRVTRKFDLNPLAVIHISLLITSLSNHGGISCLISYIGLIHTFHNFIKAQNPKRPSTEIISYHTYKQKQHSRPDIACIQSRTPKVK